MPVTKTVNKARLNVGGTKSVPPPPPAQIIVSAKDLESGSNRLTLIQRIIQVLNRRQKLDLTFNMSCDGTAAIKYQGLFNQLPQNAYQYVTVYSESSRISRNIGNVAGPYNIINKEPPPIKRKKVSLDFLDAAVDEIVPFQDEAIDQGT